MDNLTATIVPLDDGVFDKIATLVYNRFGIHLTEKKQALVRGRLQSLIRSLNLASFDDYIEYVKSDNQGDRLLQLIDRISTNHTYFFREADHFDYLAGNIIPQLLRRNSEPIRIWSAGCSSGEEPYSLAMVLDNSFGRDVVSKRIRILATDISTSALSSAAGGEYDSLKAKGVPQRYRHYFTRIGQNRISVSDSIKSMVLFRRLNLMRETYPFKHNFDVVFCRNVMIYFDQQTRDRLLSKFLHFMTPKAHLFIGHSETLGRDTGSFRYVRPTIYERL